MVLAACGPSVADVRRAQEATYAVRPERLLQVAMEAANDLYGVGAVDREHVAFVTKSFFSSQPMAHRGWGSEWARGAWTVEVHTRGARSFVIITPHAQRSLTSCRRCTPSWIDVPADDVGLGPDLEVGRDKLALAIEARARRWEAKTP
jgi:hypothetical protein